MKSVAVTALLCPLKQSHEEVTADGLTHFLNAIRDPSITVHSRTVILFQPLYTRAGKDFNSEFKRCLSDTSFFLS